MCPPYFSSNTYFSNAIKITTFLAQSYTTMIRATFLSILVLFGVNLLAQNTPYPTRFELSGGTETPTYAEGIAYYQKLDADFKTIKLFTKGPTDSGKPLHLALFSKTRNFDLKKLRAEGKAIFFINNAIHPGEPDGVDASMMLLRDLALHPERYPALDSVVVAIIPFYNIGGALNRSSTSRVDQNGPKEHGFRGNARNYDLNRDFIKADTRNARSFAAIFQELDPDFFIDTHVSNGADYQHVMTFCYTQEDKLGGVLGEFHQKTVLPSLYAHMQAKGFPSTPYVNAWGQTPDKGWTQFPDWPRYSTGYAALFHTIGIMSETHMLKPYEQRVKATYALLEGSLKLLGEKRAQWLALRRQTKAAVATQTDFPITWKVNREKFSETEFLGYEAEYPLSKVSGLKRLQYNHDKPFRKIVPFYDHYEAENVVKKPRFYVIPQAWFNVIDLLKTNQIQMQTIKRDSSIEVTQYKIDNLQTSRNVYEGHFFHNNLEVKAEKQIMAFAAGDVLVPVDQWRNRYIVETLEPKAQDSFFRWNFFDAILQEKGGFSSYHFEEMAAKLLEKSPELRQKLEEKKRSDEKFAQSGDAQLNFIYENSIFAEKEYRRYPIYRVE